MAEQTVNRSSMSGAIAIGKDLIAMLRDGAVLLMAVLLLGWPQTINRMLVNAGFEEGSFAGIKWKAKLEQSDGSLIKAQATMADLKAQNDKLAKALSELNQQVGSAETTASVAKLEQLNEQVLADAAKGQAAVASSIAANAVLVQKAQTATGTGALVTWGVVFGGDQNLADARYETKTVATKLGFPSAAIYYRQGSYRSVVATPDRVAAAQLLNTAQQGRRKDSYIVNMSTWCPEPTAQDGYFVCPTP